MEIIEQSHQILRHGTLESVELAGRTAYKSEDRITPGSAEKFVAGIIKSGHESVLEHLPLVFKIPINERDGMPFTLAARIDQEVEGLQYSDAAGYLYLSMNARTLRDAFRKCPNVLTSQLVSYARSRYPAVFWDLGPSQSGLIRVSTPDESEIVKTLVSGEAEKHIYRMVKFITDRGVSHELVRHRRDIAFTQESTRYVYSVAKPAAIDTEESVVASYNSGLSMRIISDRSDGRYTEWDVYKILDKFEVERRNIGNHGVIHDDFFDCIDTAEKAYLIGFLLADGSLHKNSNQITISQTPENSWFLVRMTRDFIKPSSTTTLNGGVSFCSDRIYNALLGKGLRPNKTYDFLDEDANSLWSSIKEDFLPDFLRGFLDGDGSIRFFQQNNPGKTFSCNISWCGHENILRLIQEWILREFKYTSGMRCISPDFWRLTVTNPSVGVRLCSRMCEHFVFPYGHPAKAPRMLEYTGLPMRFSYWGDHRFKVIRPIFWDKYCTSLWKWGEALDSSEDAYSKMIFMGSTPQQARSVLPNSLKTEIVVTTNLREWRHLFKMRDSESAHPQMRALMRPLHNDFRTSIPDMFEEG